MKDFIKAAVGGCLALFSVIMIVFMINSCCNNLTEETWNNGICTECETRYELRGANHGSKYYACPECGQEVRRY